MLVLPASKSNCCSPNVLLLSFTDLDEGLGHEANSDQLDVALGKCVKFDLD